MRWIVGSMLFLCLTSPVQAERRGPLRTLGTFVWRNYPTLRLIRGECPVPFVGNRQRYPDRANGTPWPERKRRHGI